MPPERPSLLHTCGGPPVPVPPLLAAGESEPEAQVRGPPATYSTWPETKPERGEQKNDTASATSSGWPARLTGMPATRAALNSSNDWPTRSAVDASSR